MPEMDLIPTTEVARLLNEQVRQVNRMVVRGLLAPAAKAPGLRGARLFRREDVDRLVAERTEQAS